jgi:hypothetical protein
MAGMSELQGANSGHALAPWFEFIFFSSCSFVDNKNLFYPESIREILISHIPVVGLRGCFCPRVE